MKKLLQIIISLIVMSVFAFSFDIVVLAETYYVLDGFTYRDVEHGVSIHAWDNISETMEIPELLGGKRVVGIDDFAFLRNSEINGVDFSRASYLWTIGEMSFSSSSLNGKVTITPSITKIGIGAFQGCTNLEEINYNANVKDIPKQCFMDCINLTDISILSPIESIEAYAFKNCSSLKTLTIPKTVKIINSSAFEDCNIILIKCYRNSYAMQYAIDNGINYEILDPLLGDVNGDEEINIMDATIIQKKSLGIATADVVSNYDVVADVNRDGIVNIRDVTLIQMYVAGIITEF